MALGGSQRRTGRHAHLARAALDGADLALEPELLLPRGRGPGRLGPPLPGGSIERPLCAVWLEAPGSLHGVLAQVLGFIFGARWTPAIAGFVGFAGLAGYVVGLFQWLVVRLPRLGRVAGDF